MRLTTQNIKMNEFGNAKYLKRMSLATHNT